MKKYIHILILLVSCDLFTVSGRILHEALEYVPQPKAKSAARLAIKKLEMSIYHK